MCKPLGCSLTPAGTPCTYGSYLLTLLPLQVVCIYTSVLSPRLLNKIEISETNWIATSPWGLMGCTREC